MDINIYVEKPNIFTALLEDEKYITIVKITTLSGQQSKIEDSKAITLNMVVEPDETFNNYKVASLADLSRFQKELVYKGLQN